MERRQYDRISVKLSASFSGPSYRAPGLVVGLSLAGCRALIAFLIDPDDCLGLLIHAPNAGQPLYVAQAKVRWMKGHEMGMEFVHMEWPDRQRIADMIRTIERTPEWRPAGPSDKG
jgi:hypothetical protein